MKFVIKKAGKKGKGVFALKDIKKNELIMIRDYSKLKRFKAGDKRLSKSNHVDYVGNGKYVVDKSPNSYLNHSCNPNTKTVVISKNRAKNYATTNIKAGEELTHNYSATKREIQDARKKGIYVWKMKCKCGSKNCKKTVMGI